MKTVWAAACLVVTTSLAAAAPALAGGIDEGWDEPAHVDKATWSLVSVDGPRAITFGTETGYCKGKPYPRLLRPHVVWRRTRIVITVRIFHPALHFAPHEACAGVGLGMAKQIRLARPIAGRAFYDGSESPPELREPPLR
jgi:hypothetical protein